MVRRALRMCGAWEDGAEAPVCFLCRVGRKAEQVTSSQILRLSQPHSSWAPGSWGANTLGSNEPPLSSLPLPHLPPDAL